MEITAEKRALILATPFDKMVSDLAKPGLDIIRQMNPLKAHLWHMQTGASGETGELTDAIKRFVIYDKPLDRENVVEELGDLEFYLEGIRQSLEITREETLQHNKLKLLGKRYAAGKYSDAQAIARADKAGA